MFNVVVIPFEPCYFHTLLFKKILLLSILFFLSPSYSRDTILSMVAIDMILEISLFIRKSAWKRLAEAFPALHKSFNLG
jgi:hypothetical protein